jgi:hypothetical protein
MGKEITVTFLLTDLGLFGKGECAHNQEMSLRPKTIDCVFLGYAFHSVGYIFLIVKSEVFDMHVGTIMESRDAILF